MRVQTKYILLAVGALVLVVAGLAGTKAAQFGSMMKAGSSFAPPPESVTSVTVEATKWQPTLTSVGSLVAMRAVTLASELSGAVKRIDFESGKIVRANDLVVELDTSIEEAQLASAIAEAELAAINLKRADSLRKLETNAQADLDLADTRAKQAKANVANIRAMIAKKRIRAPFEGRLGMRTVEIGQILAPGTPIVSLTDFDPIYVDFFLPQQALAEVAVDQPVRVHTDAFAETWDGKVSAINSEVDVATRNIKVRATLDNKDERLRPGMFVNVQVILPEQKELLIVSGTAIIHAPYGDSVFVIEEEKDAEGKVHTVAKQKFVRVGERRGDLVAIESGLSAGEVVVGSGAFKLRNGAKVVVNNELAPDVKLAPNPSDT